MPWNQKDSMERRLLLQAAGTLGISLFLATRLGPAMLDASFLVPMSCLSMLFVGPMVARTGKLIPAVLMSFATVAVSIALSLAWVMAGVPETAVIAKAVAASLAVTTVTGGLTLLLMTKGNLQPAVVTWIMRALMVGLYLLYRARPEYFEF